MFVTPLTLWSWAAAAQTSFVLQSAMFWQSAFASAMARPRPALRLAAFNPTIVRTERRAILAVVR